MAPARECQANTSSGSACTTLEYVSPMFVPPLVATCNQY